MQRGHILLKGYLPHTRTCLVVVFTTVPITTLFAGGDGDSGGHVL
jgi:hypothetical protein